MIGVEVIDLLSSPEPEVRRLKPLANGTTSTAASALAFGKHFSRSTFQAGRLEGGKATDEWPCISDDPDNDDHFTAPLVPKRSRQLDHMGNPPSLNLNSTNPGKLTHLAASGLKGGPSESPYSTKGEGKGEDLFLPDDFDATTDVTDPFATGLEPPAKRRRVVIEPEFMKSTYSTKEKGSGIARSLSDVVASTKASTIGMSKATGLRRSKTSILDDDPIIFSSSPDDFRAARDRKEKAKRLMQQDLDGDDDPFQTCRYSDIAAAVAHSEHGHDLRHSSSDPDLPDIETIVSQASSFPSLSRTDSKKTLATYRSEKAALQKQREKARKVQEKAELKEAEKERKRAARGEKMKEKEMAADLAKVNTLRIDKKVSTPAMIIDLPTDLDTSLAGQARRFLGPLEVECQEWNSPIPNVIKWRRKVDSVYNEEMGHWEPAPKQIKAEKHFMCVMPAKEFVDLTRADEGRDLDAHVLQMKARFDDCSIMYLVEGLTAWMRKNRNVKNRQFTEAVRSRMAQGLEEEAVTAAGQSSQKGKKKKIEQEYVDEDMIEDSLLRLQVIHGAQIHHTVATVDTAQWIMVFTQHISTIPYRQQRMTLDTAFCMESGQVKSGADAADTFTKMLQEVHRVTAPVAYGIAARYPSASALSRAFEIEGRDVLVGVRKCAVGDSGAGGAGGQGGFVDGEVGRRISRRLWGIFMGGDPGSMDV